MILDSTKLLTGHAAAPRPLHLFARKTKYFAGGTPSTTTYFDGKEPRARKSGASVVGGLFTITLNCQPD